MVPNQQRSRWQSWLRLIFALFQVVFGVVGIDIEGISIHLQTGHTVHHNAQDPMIKQSHQGIQFYPIMPPSIHATHPSTLTLSQDLLLARGHTFYLLFPFEAISASFLCHFHHVLPELFTTNLELGHTFQQHSEICSTHYMIIKGIIAQMIISLKNGLFL